MSIALPIVLVASWLFISLLPAGKLAIEDERKGIPPEQRRGVSIVPGVVMMPILFWTIARVIDRFAAPWGSRVMIAAHALALVITLLLMVRDHRTLRALTRDKR